MINQADKDLVVPARAQFEREGENEAFVGTESHKPVRLETKEIRLNANYFKLKIRARTIYQYKLAFLPPRSGPALKTREDKRELFEALVEQYVNRTADESGFNATCNDSILVRQKGLGMVFDGVDLAYFYKDLTKEALWREKRKSGNWNKALRDEVEQGTRNPGGNSAGLVSSLNKIVMIY